MTRLSQVINRLYVFPRYVFTVLEERYGTGISYVILITLLVVTINNTIVTLNSTFDRLGFLNYLLLLFLLLVSSLHNHHENSRANTDPE